MKAVILAGGFATRLWPLTDLISKPLLAVGDKPIISYLIEKIPKNIPVIISTNQVFADDYFAWQKEFHPNRNIEIFIEDSDSEKGKLGALRAVSYLINKKKINEDILLLLGDNYLTFDIADLIKKYRGNTVVGTYNIKSRDEARGFGVIELSKDKKSVVDFEEKPANPKSTYVSTGAYIIPKKYFDKFHKVAEEAPDNVGNFLHEFVAQKLPIDGYTFSGGWYDVGSFDTYLELHKNLPKAKSDNKNITASQTGGVVYVDRNSQVSNSILENVIIFGGCKVNDAAIRNSVIGKNCTIEGVDVEGKVLPSGSIIKK